MAMHRDRTMTLGDLRESGAVSVAGAVSVIGAAARRAVILGPPRMAQLTPRPRGRAIRHALPFAAQGVPKTRHHRTVRKLALRRAEGLHGNGSGCGHGSTSS